MRLAAARPSLGLLKVPLFGDTGPRMLRMPERGRAPADQSNYRMNSHQVGSRADGLVSTRPPRRLHDLLKQLYRTHNHGREAGVLPSLSFGVLSAFAGQLVAFPLETVARRLQACGTATV